MKYVIVTKTKHSTKVFYFVSATYIKINRTPLLSAARIFKNKDDARKVSNTRGYMNWADVREILPVNDKELFEARLKGK